MDVESLIASFTARGIRLIPDGNGLIVQPAGKLTDFDRQIIRSRGPQMLVYLRAGEIARWCEEHRIDGSIGTAILEIEHKALMLGWSYERLWNPDFWPHSAEHLRGLASVLSPGDELGDVGSDFIIIHKADGQQQRFMRLDS